MGPAGPTLAAGARPVPPGRTGTGPGGRMPVYQPPLAATWNGAARGLPNAPRPPTITTTMGNETNGYINSSHALKVSFPPVFPFDFSSSRKKVWSNGAHMNVREGQIMFVARNNARTDSSSDVWSKHLTEASLQHLNNMCEAGWRAARYALQQGQAALPPGISITPEQFDDISEWDIFDYIGKREADIDAKEHPTLAAACKLLKINQFKYLLPIGVLMYWNLFGGVSNISYGTAPQVFPFFSPCLPPRF